jgi:hypothetical protein
MTLALELVLLVYAKTHTFTPIFYGISIFLETALLLSFTFLVGLISTPFLAFISGITFFIAGNSLELLNKSLAKTAAIIKFIFKPFLFIWPDFTLFDLDQHLLFGMAPLALTLFLLLYTLGYVSLFLGGTSLIWRRMDL